MLSEIFGMEWYKVHDEAEQLEHAVSEDFERRLQEKLGSVDVACPHGNRVDFDTPEDRRAAAGVRSMSSSPNSASRVVSVFERDRKLLEYLEGLGVRPGATFSVIARNYDETITLRINGGPVPLGKSAAGRVWGELAT